MSPPKNYQDFAHILCYSQQDFAIQEFYKERIISIFITGAVFLQQLLPFPAFVIAPNMYQDLWLFSFPLQDIVDAIRNIPDTAAQERKSKVKIGNRPYRLVCLLCLVTSALIVTVAGFSIYVSQIRQSQITCDQNHRLHREEVNRTLRQCRLQVHELNTTLLSTISENSHMHLTQRTSLEHLSELISNLSDLKRRHSDLRHQFTEMETKYRSVNETKAQICELLTSRREVCYESCTRPKQFILDWKMPRRESGHESGVPYERWKVQMQRM
ncbi:uncharacterized protein LOC132387482 [Hypanus sabinus]|uniref:uncharacterized protein LOC132387274 n=1 Tax=Hypanus sabinus TaxID=79690 RepID=UPI0028C4DEEC|nr:uncharacterized protein LOC132387274 [Hypanus sabinus]XP_059815834.1 uncharacterized protein LOC132387482 [Hypanus sabinus]